MKTTSNEQIKSITNQLNEFNLKLIAAKNEVEEKSLLKQIAILVKKRLELAKQLGLTSWENIKGEK
jgi:hypothetical protein